MTKQIFTDATSRKLRLAGATVEKIATFVEKQGGKFPTTITTPKQAKDWCREHGWKYNGNVVNQAKKDEYGPGATCDDDVAQAMARFCRTVNPETKVEYCDLSKVEETAKINGISIDRWRHLNIGQIRMNLGNVLRGRVRNGIEVKVGDKLWNKGSEIKAKAPKPTKAKIAKAKTKKAAKKAA